MARGSLSQQISRVEREEERANDRIDDLRNTRRSIRRENRKRRKAFQEDLKEKQVKVDLQGRERSLFSLGGPGNLRGGSLSSRAISRSSLDTGTGRDNLTGGGRGRSLFNLG